MRTDETEKRSNLLFYKKMICIAFPVMVQNLISIGLNLIDTLMIGRVGVSELAAVGAANQFYFVFSMTCFGVYSGAAVYTAQYWGAKDIKNIRKIMGIDYSVGGLLAMAFAVSAFLFAPHIMWLFARDKIVIGFGVEYLQIVCFSYLFTAMTYAMSFNSRSVQRLMGPTLVNVAALLINTFLNYGLIYGNFGFPELGVRGAAIATLTARVCECLAMIVYIYKDKTNPLAASFREMTAFDSAMFRKVMRTALPVVISEGSWSVATAVYFIAYGILGPAALAVAQVASVINEFFQSIYFGLGNAAAVMIGEKLGQGKTKEVLGDSQKIIHIVMGMNVIVTVFLILIRGPVALFYEFDAGTTVLLEQTLLVWAIFITPKMLAYLLICGILRAGGDTKFCMVVDVANNWIVGLPLAFIGVAVFHLPLPFAVALVSTNEIIKAIMCWHRYNQKKWANVLIEVDNKKEAQRS